MRASLHEWSFGTSAAAAGGVAGGIGFFAEAVLGGIGAAAGGAGSVAYTESGRTTTATEEQRLRDSIRRYADSLRRLESVVVSEVSQEEDAQIQTNDLMLRNLFEPLERVSPALRHVTLLQGTKAYGVHVRPLTVPARENRSEMHEQPNFYWNQERYLRERQGGKAWRWTVLRPVLIVGSSVGSAMNVIPALGVYAAMQRRAGRTTLDFPGGAGRVAQAIDADLLARCIAWAGESASAGNEIFNITNGDVFVWPNVWPAIADALGFAAGAPVPLSLDREIRPREAEWAEIREAYGLESGTLKDFVGLSFEYADYTMGFGRDMPGPAAIVSTIKLMQAGFTAVMDTEAMFRKCFAEMQAQRLLPPR